MTKQAITMVLNKELYIHVPSFIELLKAEKKDWGDGPRVYIDRLINELTEKQNKLVREIILNR